MARTKLFLITLVCIVLSGFAIASTFAQSLPVTEQVVVQVHQVKLRGNNPSVYAHVNIVNESDKDVSNATVRLEILGQTQVYSNVTVLAGKMSDDLKINQWWISNLPTAGTEIWMNYELCMETCTGPISFRIEDERLLDQGKGIPTSIYRGVGNPCVVDALHTSDPHDIWYAEDGITVISEGTIGPRVKYSSVFGMVDYTSQKRAGKPVTGFLESVWDGHVSNRIKFTLDGCIGSEMTSTPSASPLPTVTPVGQPQPEHYQVFLAVALRNDVPQTTTDNGWCQGITPSGEIVKGEGNTLHFTLTPGGMPSTFRWEVNGNVVGTEKDLDLVLGAGRFTLQAFVDNGVANPACSAEIISTPKSQASPTPQPTTPPTSTPPPTATPRLIPTATPPA
jgi:hypothetical protein